MPDRLAIASSASGACFQSRVAWQLGRGRFASQRHELRAAESDGGYALLGGGGGGRGLSVATAGLARNCASVSCAETLPAWRRRLPWVARGDRLRTASLARPSAGFRGGAGGMARSAWGFGRVRQRGLGLGAVAGVVWGGLVSSAPT